MNTNCPYCGGPIGENVQFCPSCGASLGSTPPPEQQISYPNFDQGNDGNASYNQNPNVTFDPNMATQNSTEQKTNTDQTALILSIVGIFVCGLPLGIIAVIFACRSKTENGEFTEKAKTALVLGIIDIVLVSLYIIGNSAGIFN